MDLRKQEKITAVIKGLIVTGITFYITNTFVLEVIRVQTQNGRWKWEATDIIGNAYIIPILISLCIGFIVATASYSKK